MNMKVTYHDNEGGGEIFAEECDNVAELLAFLKEHNEVNLRWPDKDSFWQGRFYNAILDIEVDEEGNSVKTLMVFLEHINSQ
ncbi:hypothetical protein PM3016_5453 [Paenibacillus mucilaginosus 3016]|uniref:Uncharacterized protein n=1 Tax=Paenibacillus mucilaginosus 3016 TaxID=1116391 RepID=H6NDV4_9BACL|nr:hypothetical protein [Paenibacillus mucilaginosus]AFC32153.1 hypothetical protein PM3016_5453 [Paenibacillus mucilaginosus 3016]WFA20654.1 hypothetical protein ERY13_27145 [Paenibacillus mucilaginosus]